MSVSSGGRSSLSIQYSSKMLASSFQITGGAEYPVRGATCQNVASTVVPDKSQVIIFNEKIKVYKTLLSQFDYVL